MTVGELNKSFHASFGTSIKVYKNLNTGKGARVNDIDINAMARLARSDNWRERLEAAWTLRESEETEHADLVKALANDSYEDEDGCFVVREGVGEYDD